MFSGRPSVSACVHAGVRQGHYKVKYFSELLRWAEASISTLGR